jgi:hypothetical protein
MGNRATVIFAPTDAEANVLTISPAIYLHWNGGPESIYAFLDELNRRNCRPDGSYEAAVFIAIVREFFDQEKYGTLSLGVRMVQDAVLSKRCRITPRATTTASTSSTRQQEDDRAPVFGAPDRY